MVSLFKLYGKEVISKKKRTNDNLAISSFKEDSSFISDKIPVRPSILKLFCIKLDDSIIISFVISEKSDVFDFLINSFNDIVNSFTE